MSIVKKNSMAAKYVNLYEEFIKGLKAPYYQRRYEKTVSSLPEISNEIIQKAIERANAPEDEPLDECYLGVMIKEVNGKSKSIVDGLQRFMTILIAILAHNDYVLECMPYRKHIPVPTFEFCDPVDQEEFAKFLACRKKGTTTYHRAYRFFYSLMKANKKIIDEIADVIMNDIRVNMTITTDGFKTFQVVNTNHIELGLSDTILSYLKDYSYKYGIELNYNRNEIEDIMAGYFYAHSHASYKFSMKQKDGVSKFIENNVVDTAEHFYKFKSYLEDVNAFQQTQLYAAMKDTSNARIWKYAYALIASGHKLNKINGVDVKSLWALINVSTFVQHGKSKTATFGAMIDEFTSNPNPVRVLKDLYEFCVKNKEDCMFTEDQIIRILNDIPEKVQRGLRRFELIQSNQNSNMDCGDLSLEHAYSRKRIEEYYIKLGFPATTKDQERLYKHFGNTCLIPQDKNSECGNHSLDVKSYIYKDLFAKNTWLATAANVFDADEYIEKHIDYANTRARLFVESLRETPMGNMFIRKSFSFGQPIIGGIAKSDSDEKAS